MTELGASDEGSEAVTTLYQSSVNFADSNASMMNAEDSMSRHRREGGREGADWVGGGAELNRKSVGDKGSNRPTNYCYRTISNDLLNVITIDDDSFRLGEEDDEGLHLNNNNILYE